jgi:hypothetical protein
MEDNEIYYQDSNEYKLGDEIGEEMDGEECQIDLKKQTSYSIITDKEISKQREKLIEKTVDFTCLSRDEAILALIHFKWQWTQLEEKWYDNAEKYIEEIGISQSSISRELTEDFINKDYCLCCFTPCCPYFEQTCRHTFCQSCWQEYLKSRVQNIDNVLFVTCPQKDCNIRIPESVFLSHFVMDGRALYILEMVIKKNFLENNSDIKSCLNCNTNVICQGKSNTEIDCACGTTFCFKCLRDGHRPCPCDMVFKWDTKLFLYQNQQPKDTSTCKESKKCPKCKQLITKNKSTSHTTCCSCSYEFCWLCSNSWKGHIPCNRYKNKTGLLLKEVKTERQMERVREETEKLLHFKKRFNNQEFSYKKSIELRLAIDEYEILFETKHNVPIEELGFIREGVETLIKARRLLKNSYIFGYFIATKSLFEHLQSLLETNVEQLHEYYEIENLKLLVHLDNFEFFSVQFKDFKNNVINLSKATSQFVENLINECEGNISEWMYGEDDSNNI